MTYVPVPPAERKGHGRKPLEIPAALIAQLQHSRATGARCRLDLTPEDDQSDVDELRRAAVRATYTHFQEHRLKWVPDESGVTFHLQPKRPRPAAKKR